MTLSVTTAYEPSPAFPPPLAPIAPLIDKTARHRTRTHLHGRQLPVPDGGHGRDHEIKTLRESATSQASLNFRVVGARNLESGELAASQLSA